MNGLRRQKYRTLLVSLVLLTVVYPLLRDQIDAHLLFDAFLTVVFLAAFLVVFRQRHHRLAALLLGVPTLLGAWTGYVLPGVPRIPLAVGFHLVAATFLVFTAATVVREISEDKAITQDDIYGAFCGYVLIAMAFSHLYLLIDVTNPGSFRGLPATAEDGGHRHFLMVYFSFVTLTTVGYGDITPAGGGARGLVVVEAMIGQFYVAVLIAQLVGKHLAQTASRNPPPPPTS